MGSAAGDMDEVKKICKLLQEEEYKWDYLAESLGRSGNCQTFDSDAIAESG